MPSDEAGRPEEMSALESTGQCQHKRILNYQYDEKGQRTGNLICHECGAVIPDPLMKGD